MRLLVKVIAATFLSLYKIVVCEVFHSERVQTQEYG